MGHSKRSHLLVNCELNTSFIHVGFAKFNVFSESQCYHFKGGTMYCCQGQCQPSKNGGILGAAPKKCYLIFLSHPFQTIARVSSPPLNIFLIEFEWIRKRILVRSGGMPPSPRVPLLIVIIWLHLLTAYTSDVEEGGADAQPPNSINCFGNKSLGESLLYFKKAIFDLKAFEHWLVHKV